MKTRTTALLLGLSIVVTFGVLWRSQAEILPWPWGSECPFPWSKIEGSWESRSGTRVDRFEFSINGTLDNGTRKIEVLWYDGKGSLVGSGEGLAPTTEKIVRAAMVGEGTESGNSYWALVRTYTSSGKKTCAKGQQVTVITLRPAQGSGEDRHFVIEKVDESTRRKAR